MLRHIARFPLRRSWHSQASSSSRLLTPSLCALAASATIAGYVVWSCDFNDRLDLETIPAPKTQLWSPQRTSAPGLSDISAPPTPRSDAPPLTTMPLEGAEPSSVPQDTQAEGEESSGGAFNPETGEINWDCPCLGGMAHGPCGQQFRDAFSCFIHSEADIKGMDCVEKFKAMQDCFREHPDVYGDEIMDDDDEPPVGSMTTEKMDSEQPSNSPSPETTEPAPGSTLT